MFFLRFSGCFGCFYGVCMVGFLGFSHEFWIFLKFLWCFWDFYGFQKTRLGVFAAASLPPPRLGRTPHCSDDQRVHGG